MTVKRYSKFGMIPVGSHAQITTSGSAVEIPASSDERATILVMQNTTTSDSATAVDVRYTMDGTDPTATKGFNLEDGDPEVRWDFGIPVPTVKVYLTAGARLDYQWFTRS